VAKAKRSKTTSKYKICNKCDASNSSLSKQCTQCGSKKFAPEWVKDKRSISRYLSVQITASNPEFGKPQDRLTLSKWWPGGASTFHIPTPEQWASIKNAIDGDLAGVLKWASKTELVKNISSYKREGKAVARDLKKIAAQYPDIVGDATSAIAAQAKKFSSVDDAFNMSKKLSDALKNASSGFKDAFLRLVDELPKQKIKAVEGLADALEKWELHQILSVAQEVRKRLDTIELFRERVLDEKTYEIIGDNSIHRILEQSMWMVDERYWLMHSNSTLRTIIGDKLAKKDARFAKKRPDFVCGSIGSKLIIIELKRPSHKLDIDDLNQLETNLTLASEYSTEFKSAEGYLIGQAIDSDLERRKKYSSSNFHIMTFSDLINDAERRYKDYLKHYKAIQED